MKDWRCTLILLVFALLPAQPVAGIASTQAPSVTTEPDTNFTCVSATLDCDKNSLHARSGNFSLKLIDKVLDSLIEQALVIYKENDILVY